MKKTTQILVILAISTIILNACDNFKTVKIGDQVWMAENLNVDKFQNGDPIPEAKTNEEWEEARKYQQPAWCYFNNDPTNKAKYGKLYNWYAVNDPRGLAPKGWHVPRDAEWEILIKFFGSGLVVGIKLSDFFGWGDEDYIIPLNESGFSARPGGYRDRVGDFYALGYQGYWWTASRGSDTSARYRHIDAVTFEMTRDFAHISSGFSVRCVQDN